jgi:hypothetical protein
MLKMFTTSIYNTTHLKWMYKATQISCTIVSQLPLIITLNSWGNEWTKNVFWNYNLNALLIGQYKLLPIVIH